MMTHKVPSLNLLTKTISDLNLHNEAVRYFIERLFDVLHKISLYHTVFSQAAL